MSDEDALLAAIAAHPDEDTPRLAYADWLDEHDQPIRAEFIRVQIDISQKELLPRGEQDRYVDVWKRNQELLDEHRREILGKQGWLTDWKALEFRRGFVSELQADPREFWANRKSLSEMQPLPRVVVVGEPFAIREFLGLDASSPRQDSQAHIVSAVRTDSSLVNEPHPRGWFYPQVWGRLNELGIASLGLSYDNVAALMRTEAFPALDDLDVSNNELTDAAIMPLLRSGIPRQLKRLVLGENPLSDIAAQLLVEQWPTGADDRLKELNLRYTNIGTPGHGALTARFGGKVVLF